MIEVWQDDPLHSDSSSLHTMNPDGVAAVSDQDLHERELALRKIDERVKTPEEFQEEFELVKEVRRRAKILFPTLGDGSVFSSQLPVHSIRSMIYLTERELDRLKAQLEEATQAHRDQIRKSLVSPNPEERDAAQRIAAFWEVPT